MKVAIVKLSYDVKICVPIEDLSDLLAKFSKYPQIKHEHTDDGYAYSYTKSDTLGVEIIERDEILDPDGLSPKVTF